MMELVGKILLNRYRVDSFIGRGGMAEVYRVWDQQRAVFLAMKLLREDLAEDVVFLRRFKREAENLARMQHPHIVRSYGLERQGRIAFLLMDYVEGSTLRGEVFDSGKPIPLQRVLAVMRPVCSALHYAHQMGMVHCDIKPANIMIESSGRVLVADFGIARMTDAATATMVGAGTPAYMAPEQVRGLDPTPQTDIYALGVVLYEMLTGGERPFTGEHAQTTGSTSEKVRWEQMHRAPPSPRRYNQGISPELEAVVMRCLEKDPGKRYSSALDMLNALSMAMGDVASPNLTPGASPLRGGGEEDKPRQGGEVARRSKRNLLLLGIGGIALVVVLGVMLVAGIGRVSQGQQRPELSIGSTQVSPKDGIVMIYVPEGEFLMGASDSDTGAENNEKPQHTVYLDAYWIDKTEVTNTMYAKCVTTGVCKPPYENTSYARAGYYGNNQFADYPVINVDWNQANAYCHWAGERLPTEAEWEKAARGTDGNMYPWGDGIDCSMANYGGKYGGCEGDTEPVGSYLKGASVYGVLDMAGNVWEWVADWYAINYYSSSPSENPKGPGSGDTHVLRGGSWINSSKLQRSSLRNWYFPDSWNYHSGFRCIR